jgi:transcriptional regulator with XRE-family HTH domain
MSGFGGALRRLRQEQGLSLTQLAAATSYSKGYLSRLERGARPATADIARVCDSALGADGQLIAAFRDGEAAHTEQRSLLGLLSTSSTSSSRHWVNGVRSDAHVYLEQLEMIFASLRAMGHSMSPTLVLPMLLTHDETAQHVVKSAGPGDRDKLLRLIARIKEYAGWMAQEAGQIDLAERLTEEARRIALAIGDSDLARWMLVRFADLDLYRGDGPKIVSLTREIVERRDIGLRTRSIAWQRQAQGHALLGDRASCMRALDQARVFHEADRAEPDVQTLGTLSVLRPVETTRGWALVDLCAHEKAAEELSQVIAELDPKSVRSRVRYTTRLALACAAVGDPERACELVREALPDIDRVDSDTVRVDLKALAGLLRRRWSGNSSVSDLLAGMRSQVGWIRFG